MTVFATTKPAAGQKSKPALMARALIEFDTAQASLAFDGSTLVGPFDTTYIAGTKGSARSEGPDLNDQTVTLTTSAGSVSLKPRGTWFTNGFHGTMAELLCSIEENRTPNNNARDNLKSLALCFAALASADSGEARKVGSCRKAPA
jgi:predicted dehydrogenase